MAATNIMLVITTAMASRGEGWASSLNYAFRLVHLPIGIVGVALGTVVLAAGSRRGASAPSGRVRNNLRTVMVTVAVTGVSSTGHVGC